MECNTSCEPMDIDLSSNSVNAMDISYSEQTTFNKKENASEPLPNSSPRHSPSFKKLVVDLTANNSNSRKSAIFYTLGIIILLLSGVLYHLNTSFKCKGNLNIEEITHKLSNRLYGQSTATSKIVNTLKSQDKTKMLIMYGRTGVGKTLSVSLILEDIISFSNVYHYTMPTFMDVFSTDLLLGLTLCENSIVVIDDLKNNDMLQIKDKVLALLAKSKDLNKNLTLILVYNCGAMDDQYLASKHSFIDSDVLKVYIEFSQLDESTLRKCVEYELRDRKISEEMFKYILKRFNVSQDGCKSVHQKMKYLNVL